MLQIPLLGELVAVQQLVQVPIDLHAGPNAEVNRREVFVVPLLVFISLPFQELAVWDA